MEVSVGSYDDLRNARRPSRTSNGRRRPGWVGCQSAWVLWSWPQPLIPVCHFLKLHLRCYCFLDFHVAYNLCWLRRLPPLLRLPLT